MFGLIYKELITHKKQLLAILPILIFFIGFSVIPPTATPDLTELELELVLILCSIMVMITLTLFEQGIFEADEIKRWQSYIASAPDGIRKQIGAKYIFNALLSCVTVSILTVAFSAASCINETDVNISDMLLYQLLWLQLFINAVEIPFLVRFGSKHGNEFRMIFVALITMIAIIYGLFGDLSVFGSLESFLRWIKDFLTDTSSYFLLITPAVTMVLYYISYKISCRLYLKGGQYYDK